MSFFFQQLPKDSQVIIYIPYQRRVIKSWLTEDGFNFNTSATWNDPQINSSAKQINDVIHDFYAANNIWLANSTKRVQHDFVALLQSVSSYQNSGKLGFSLNLTFLATRTTDNVIDEVNALQCCTLPAKFENKPQNSDKDKFPLGRVIAPMNYTMTEDTCISVNIGRWFRTPQVWLISSVNAKFSKETIKGTGLPLYATASVTFEAYRMMDAEDVKGWFALTGADRVKKEGSLYYEDNESGNTANPESNETPS